jgi:hypothetical protein
MGSRGAEGEEDPPINRGLWKGGGDMLVCSACGKLIANVDPSTVRYRGCAQCRVDEVKQAMEKLKLKNKKEEDDAKAE